MEEEEPIEGPKEVIVIEEGPKMNGLIWASGPLSKNRTWRKTIKFLEGTGWRLPSKNEMLKLCIACRIEPTRVDYYWHSIEALDDKRGVWPVKEK